MLLAAQSRRTAAAAARHARLAVDGSAGCSAGSARSRVARVGDVCCGSTSHALRSTRHISTSSNSSASVGDGGPGIGARARAALSDRNLDTSDPLIAYRALVAAGVVQQDPEQVRALVELRKLTRTLQNYTPPAHLLGVLHDSSGKVPSQQEGERGSSQVNAPASNENINALVRHLSEEEQVQELDTPRGLLLTGTPGTGKTFLVDLWLGHLPVRQKFRRHYHHLLLHIYRLIWVEAEKRRIQAAGLAQAAAGVAEHLPGSSASPDTVSPDRGVGAVWERTDSGAKAKGKGKSIADWARSIKGMPFRRAERGAPAPVMSLDGASLDDEANKGMNVVKLAQLEKQEDVAAGAGTTLPMHVAAELFLTHGHVLVLDELQLLDIASATLLRRILTSYWRLGGVVVATSNRVPEDLYANNVQRRSLVAFLGALKERCPVVEIGGRDWRVERWKEGWDKFALAGDKGDDGEQSTFFMRGKPDEDKAFRALVGELAGDRQAAPTTVKVYNRNVLVPESYAPADGLPSMASFTFTQLCDQPLGAADYLTLAATFSVIVLDDVPALDLEHRNQARRLITLIDCLYESRCQLILRSRVPLTKIFFAREGEEVARENARLAKIAAGELDPDAPASAEIDLLQSAALIQSETLSEAAQDTEEGFRPNVVAYGPIVDNDTRPEPGRASAQQEKERQQGGNMRNLSIFSGEEERFAYQRAVSRLWEMSHATWKEMQWKPLVEAELGAWQQPSASSAQQKAGDAVKDVQEALRASAMTSHASRGSDEADMSDFGDEASYRSAGTDERRRASMAQQRNMGPPIVSEAHVWGVRDDWGPKAGRWGRGVRDLVDEDDGDADTGESPRDRRSRLREERLKQQQQS